MTRIDFERLIKEIIKIEKKCNNLITRFAVLSSDHRGSIAKYFIAELDDVIAFIEKIKYEVTHNNIERQAIGYYIGVAFYAMNIEFMGSICEEQSNDRPSVH